MPVKHVLFNVLSTDISKGIRGACSACPVARRVYYNLSNVEEVDAYGNHIDLKFTSTDIINEWRKWCNENANHHTFLNYIEKYPNLPQLNIYEGSISLQVRLSLPKIAQDFIHNFDAIEEYKNERAKPFTFGLSLPFFVVPKFYTPAYDFSSLFPNIQ